MRFVDLAPASPFAVIALVLWGAGISAISEARGFAAGARSVPGVVTRVEWSTDRDGGSLAAPVVRFEVDGRAIEIRGGVRTTPASHAVGDTIEVMVPPGNPEKARIWSFGEQYLFPVVGLVAGLPFAIAAYAAASWSAGRRREREEAGLGEG